MLLLLVSIKVYIFIHRGIFACEEILVNLYIGCWWIVYLLFFFLCYIYFSFLLFNFFVRLLRLLLLFVVVLIGRAKAGLTLLIIAFVLLCGSLLLLFVTILIFVVFVVILEYLLVYVLGGVIGIGEQVRVKLEEGTTRHKLHL